MPLLVRKIELGKWMQNPITDGAPVSADAITICTRTKANKISVWSIPNEMAVEEAVLAMAAAPLAKYFDTLHVVILEETELAKSGLNVEVSDGHTTATDLVHRHRDIVGLTYPLLGVYSQLIVKEIKADRVKRFSKAQLRKIVNDAIKHGRVSQNDLSKELKSDLMK